MAASRQPSWTRWLTRRDWIFAAVPVGRSEPPALGKQKGATASEVLRERLASDTDLDVRLAAAEALGEIRDPASVPALGVALQDRDPAMQYQAVCSLRQVAPTDLGNDVERWRQYVKDGSIAPPKSVPLAEQFRNIFR